MSEAKRFSRDVVWNLASVGVLGVCGVSLNLVIGRYYSTDTLGVFLQVLAVHYVLSQLAVGGFVFSALNFAGKHAGDRQTVRTAVTAGLLCTLLLAAGVCLAGYALSGPIGRWVDSADVSRGIRWTLPGLWCFALNKVLLFSLNGLRHMRVYAAGNSIRYVLILATVVVLTAIGADGSMLPLALSVSEIVLLPGLAGYFFNHYPPSFAGGMGRWMREHVRFSGRTFFTGLLLDMNSKVDVLMLGYFLSDAVVGVYGFAAMLAVEGMYQIIVVIQTNMNPILSRLFAEGRMGDARGLVRNNIRWLCPATAALGVAGTLLFPAITAAVTGSDELASGWVYFAVLMSGITIGSSYIPFGFILNQWGHPGWFMVYSALVVLTNVVLNALLIPLWGALGAAIATAIAFAGVIVYLKVLTRLVTGARI